MRRKSLSFAVLLIVLVFLVGCTSNDVPMDSTDTTNIEIFSDNSTESNNSNQYTIDYENSKVFEKALNDGEEVAGKIVSFDVAAYKPDSAMGINCWSGEHLNFISDSALDVKEGDIVIGRIKEQPIDVVGSWWIPYEIIEIIPTEEEIVSVESTTVKDAKIKVTMSEEELKNLKTNEAEKKLKNMGFTVFEYETLDAGDKSDLDGKIGAVEIKTWELGKGNFSKGDTYDSDAIVVLWTYKYTKPKSVSYSTNDEKTVKNGNSGIYAYKNIGESYDVYWIIDFDEGYAYWFAHGNGDGSVDKVKIESGDLNSVAIVTYHDGDDVWSNGLHFKYKNQPDHLIVEDHNGFEYDFYPTNLNSALNLRDTKIVLNY